MGDDPAYFIEQAWEPRPDGEGFYVLRGGSNWASVEGFASEWLAIAGAIRNRNEAVVYARRCAVRRHPPGGSPDPLFEFWSPRNAVSVNDTVTLLADEADALAGQIVRCLRDAGEACVRQDFDPIHMGA